MNTVLWADSAPEQWHFHKCSPAQTQLGGSSVRATLAEVGRAALAVAVPRPTHHFRSIPRLEKCAQKSIQINFMKYVVTTGSSLHRLNMELDLHSFFGLLPVCSCTHWLRLLPSHLGSYTKALLVSQDRRHLCVTHWYHRIAKKDLTMNHLVVLRVENVTPTAPPHRKNSISLLLGYLSVLLFYINFQKQK